VNLFLLAHQDDEYFVAPLLAEDPANAQCVFLTMGDFHGTSCAVRNAESMRALRSLGVPEEQIVFAGEKLRVPDNDLASHLSSVLAWLGEECAGAETVFAPAYEGGHPDHDAACLLGHAFAAQVGALPVFEFAAYRAHPLVPYFFEVMKPVPDGTAEATNGPAGRFNWKSFTLFRFYPSQWRTWLGLLPPLVVNFVAGGRTGIRRVGRRDFGVRPHAGKLYYEYRGWNTFDRFLAQTEEFRRVNPSLS
jgi:hypothetical protein